MVVPKVVLLISTITGCVNVTVSLLRAVVCLPCMLPVWCPSLGDAFLCAMRGRRVGQGLGLTLLWPEE